MRLTVGPLPAAVYWRRRLLVLGVLVLVVVGIVYACTSGPDGADPDPVAHQTSTPTSTPSPTQTPTPTPSPTASPTPTAFTLPVTAPTGPCTDAEIGLTASATPNTLTVGQAATFTLAIKNIGTRSCIRDIGSAEQELQLRLNGVVVWSSDDCPADDPYSFDQELAPGTELPFRITWYGYRTRSGNDEKDCSQSQYLKPEAATYELIARLGTKFSQPVQVQIRSS